MNTNFEHTDPISYVNYESEAKAAKVKGTPFWSAGTKSRLHLIVDHKAVDTTVADRFAIHAKLAERNADGTIKFKILDGNRFMHVTDPDGKIYAINKASLSQRLGIGKEELNEAIKNKENMSHDDFQKLIKPKIEKLVNENVEEHSKKFDSIIHKDQNLVDEFLKSIPKNELKALINIKFKDPSIHQEIDDFLNSFSIDPQIISVIKETLNPDSQKNQIAYIDARLRAIDKNDLVDAAKANNEIAQMYETGKGVLQSATSARVYYMFVQDDEKADPKDRASAGTAIGKMFYEGRGVNQDLKTAHLYFSVAADQGNAEAQYYEGILFENGKGVEQSKSKAEENFQKASDQGYAAATYRLGMLKKTRLDLDGAIQELKKAIGQTNHPVEAYVALAQIYDWTVYRNDKLAFENYKLAADNGNGFAQFKVGHLYENGIGVKKDLSLALRYFNSANLSKVEGAQQRIDGIVERQDDERSSRESH